MHLREIKVSDEGEREGVHEAGPLPDLGLSVVAFGLQGLGADGHGEAVQVEDDPDHHDERHLRKIQPHFVVR